MGLGMHSCTHSQNRSTPSAPIKPWEGALYAAVAAPALRMTADRGNGAMRRRLTAAAQPLWSAAARPAAAGRCSRRRAVAAARRRNPRAATAPAKRRASRAGPWRRRRGLDAAAAASVSVVRSAPAWPARAALPGSAAPRLCRQRGPAPGGRHACGRLPPVKQLSQKVRGQRKNAQLA